jgi:hypothetical protein
MTFTTTSITYYDLRSSEAVTGPVTMASTPQTPIRPSEDFASLIVKVLAAQIGVAVRAAADILPSVATHIFLGYEVFLEIRYILSNLDDTYRRVQLGPDAPVSLEV